jgi:hypothetical protein
VEILLQGGAAGEEFDSSTPSLRSICQIAHGFGASIVATSRYAVENSRRPVALVLCHVSRDNRPGPAHIYTSGRFEAEFGWRSGRAPWQRLRPALQCAAAEAEEAWPIADRRGEAQVLGVEKMHTGYAALVLVAPESRRRTVKRLLVPGTVPEPV